MRLSRPLAALWWNVLTVSRTRRSVSLKARTESGEAIIDIASWLREIGLAEHAEIFRTEKIDAAVLPTLTDADLRELGLPLGDRKKLRAAIDALGTTPSGAPPTPEGIQGAAPRSAAEQRHLTVMFCDIVDSTRLAATLELGGLQGLVEAYQQHVATCVARYDGFVAKFMGDGVLVYFGYPQAHEDDAERASPRRRSILLPRCRPCEPSRASNSHVVSAFPAALS